MASPLFRPRPLQKCIDVKSIRDWVPEQARQRVDTARAWAIIRDHFCAAVVARGVCPIQCERCREEIVDLFRLEKAENPAALLTWLAKDHSARWIEKLILEQKASEQFPTQETTNPQQAYDSLFLSQKQDPLAELRKQFDA